MGLWSEILVIFLLVIANGLFSGAEIAILSIRKTRLAELAERSTRGRALFKLRSDPERFLATIQVGITVIGATAAAFGGATLADPLARWLTAQGVGEHADDIALTVVVVGVSYFTLVLGELVPKSLALRVGERYALFTGLPLVALSYLARPLIAFLAGSSNLVLRLFHDQTSFTETRVSPEEIHRVVEEATQAGTLHPEAGEIASRAVDFAQLKVSAVMVPRVDMVCIDVDASFDRIRDLLLANPYRRFPVYQGELDNVLGYVTHIDLLNAMSSKHGSIAKLVREVYFVPETVRAIDVLKQLQTSRAGLAIVVREQGSVAGLVTIEDLVEELVGEIFSEHEPRVERIRELPDGSILVDASLGVHELNRELGLELPIGPRWSTLAGLAIALHGSLPRPGTRVRLEDGIELEVVDATPRRVRAIKLRRPAVEVAKSDA
ncbi:MAG: hemolysin family protein [Pseudomonadota bacterium]